MSLVEQTTSQKKERTIQWLYDQAVEGYVLIPDTTTEGDKQICQMSAVRLFWEATVLGHPRAPLGLYYCFGQGIGVKENKSIATLWFGVSLKLEDERALKIQEDKDRAVIIPESMTKVISDVIDLIKKTHKKIPLDSAIDQHQLTENQHSFSNKIKDSIGISMSDCFTDKNNDEAGPSSVRSTSLAEQEDSSDAAINEIDDRSGSQPLVGVTNGHSHAPLSDSEQIPDNVPAVGESSRCPGCCVIV